jgi:Ca2+-binding EF-hand superfamily protein
MASGNPNNRNNNDFNLDKQEYHSVFNFFDMNKKGEININEVYDLIQKFDEKTNPAPQKKKRKEISGGRMSSD